MLLGKAYKVVMLWVLLIAGAVSLVPETASCGELFRSYNRRTGVRRPKSSTNADRRLTNMHSSRQVSSLRTSSPYEYRIIQARNDDAKYQQRLAKWQYKNEQAEMKRELKDKREKAKIADKEARRAAREKEKRELKREKEERERAKLARQQQAQDQKKGLLSFGQSSEAAKPRGDMFTSPNAEQQTVEPKRRSFWQRIKDWFFGPSSTTQTRSRAGKKYATTRRAILEPRG